MRIERTPTIAAVLASLCLGHSAPEADAALRLPHLFGNNMVLQQGRPVPIWGWADPGERVAVRIQQKNGNAVANATTTADQNGRWRLHIGPLQVGGPYTLTIQAGNTVTLRNVLVGEVWVCSGQSNMGWPVSRAKNAQQEIARANWPQIRLFTVAHRVAEQPVDDVEGEWRLCSPETVGSFSAVGYFFGRELHKALKVPVGLIHSSWGGTPAESSTAISQRRSSTATRRASPRSGVTRMALRSGLSSVRRKASAMTIASSRGPGQGVSARPSSAAGPGAGSAAQRSVVSTGRSASRSRATRADRGAGPTALGHATTPRWTASSGSRSITA